MERDEFINLLMLHCPNGMSEEQMDGIEQFCFKLFDSMIIDIRIEQGAEL